MQRESGHSESLWANTPVANLVRYVPSGIYFARVRVGGKLFRKSLKTDVFTVAQLRLADFIKERRGEMEEGDRVARGKMSVGDAIEVYRQRLQSNPRIKPGTRVYREKCIDLLLRTWPSLSNLSATKVSKDACRAWAGKLAADYSPSVYNNTVGTLRLILEIAIEKGARYGNPAMAIAKRRPTQKLLKLPTFDQFGAFVQAIEKGGGWCSRDCADLVRFLAYGGFRKQEAANITWGDCDFDKEMILVRGDAITGTKNSQVRHVPMIPEMRAMLDQMRHEREDEPPSTSVMRVRECQKAVDRAAKQVGMARITHHDFRHFFATRCIESGVDIPTVSRWLGHKDGGALAMKTYGHLRDEHSAEMAKKVVFTKSIRETGAIGL